MPQISVYVSTELREHLRGSDVPISETCQKALWAELTANGRRRPGSPIPGQLALNNQEAK